ncbi:hypothetical protein N8716_00070 [Pontimonas sp.]|nr:hypothetical protein [Pontimonas sp.]
MEEGHRVVAVSEATRLAGSKIGLFDGAVSIPGNIRGLATREPRVSEEAIREYDLYRKSARFSSNHATLLLMMSRVDTSGTFRGLEREVLARRINLEAFEILSESQPDIAVFDVTPHEAFEFALFQALAWKAIPTLMFQPSLVGPQMVARVGVSEVLSVPFRESARDTTESAWSEIVAISMSALGRLRAGTGTPKIDSQKAKEASSRRLRSKFWAWFRSVLRLGKSGPNSEFSLTGHNIRSQAWRSFLEVYLERSLRLSLKKSVHDLPDLASAPENRFALMALHYEPERCSIPEGWPFDSQLDAILAVRNFLPDDVELIVKEHFSQQAAALRGFVGRSPDFYAMVKALPGVRLAGVNSATKILIDNAECVATLTGKVGIEAAMAGTPVLALGQPWWLGMPGATSLSLTATYEEFCAATVPSPRLVEDWLSRQVRYTLLPGLASVSPERYAQQVQPLPAGFELLEAGAVTAALRSLISLDEG